MKETLMRVTCTIYVNVNAKGETMESANLSTPFFKTNLCLTCVDLLLFTGMLAFQLGTATWT